MAKRMTTLEANEAIKSGFFSDVANTGKKDASIMSEAIGELGSTSTPKLLDETFNALHASSGGSYFKSALKLGTYGMGLIAAADFFNPFSLGWND